MAKVNFYQVTNNEDVHKEVGRLLERWDKGSFDTLMDSIEYHFEKHGNEVGAESIVKYLRKAEEFRRSYKSATMTYLSGGTPGTKKYKKKSGEFIIISVSGKILSYGRNGK